MMQKSILGFVVGLLVSVPAPAIRADWQVWTLNQTRRVLRSDPPGAARSVNISAARNEWEGFQILMRADEPVKGVNIIPADLAGPGGAVLKAADARLYRQHQFFIKSASYRNNQFKPDWYPDGLIPFVHPLTGKPLGPAQFKAVPFDLPPGESHGFWCDLYVPPDAKPGPYSGTYKITADGGKAIVVPVTLWVWNFRLPNVLTMKNWFGSPLKSLRIYCDKHAQRGDGRPLTDTNGARLQAQQLLSDHHINVRYTEFSPVSLRDGTYQTPPAQVRTLRDYVDRYHINTMVFWLPAEVTGDPQGGPTRLRAWLAELDRVWKELNRPDLQFVCYLFDEPSKPEHFQFIRTWGPAIRQAKSVVQVMVTAEPQRNPNLGDLFGAVDIWCANYAHYPANSAAKRQALGETIWTYTALCQGERRRPWWQTDFPLLNYRVPAWIMWHYRGRGLLYWGGMAFWDEVANAWTDPDTKPGSGIMFNGEGTLVYPGREVGYDGIAPSLRLKALRDSIEDYEYLAILERLGRDAEAGKIVTPIAGAWDQWDLDPMAYELARSRLAELIEKATKEK